MDLYEEKVEKTESTVIKEKLYRVLVLCVVIISIFVQIMNVASKSRFNWDNLYYAAGIKDDPELMPLAKVKFLSSGQGNMTLIVIGEKAYVVDCGPANNEGKIIRNLKKMNISEIEAVIISHHHNDHMGSLPGLLKSVTIHQVIMSDYLPKEELDLKYYNEIISTAEEKGVPINKPHDHQKFQESNGEIELYLPDQTASDENNRSIVVMARLSGVKFLFMGDNGFPTESYFMENNYDLNADVLEVGHHGSKNSTSAAFINRVTPKNAIFSFGYNNYSHPAETVAEKLYESGCSLHYIHVHGSITVNVYNKWYNIMNSEDIEYYGEK